MPSILQLDWSRSFVAAFLGEDAATDVELVLAVPVLKVEFPPLPILVELCGIGLVPPTPVESFTSALVPRVDLLIPVPRVVSVPTAELSVPLLELPVPYTELLVLGMPVPVAELSVLGLVFVSYGELPVLEVPVP